ncbi:unknown protein [Simkania negevensis Z]|uniref:Uncharacterized protein n=1 Tax=Simkania negevensis (strain ATCC VR-1471 / DSM 27360 / Z) TaxID=331113 RepID=F8L860_SIMNZ|nr:unknown protein [Simkania negevensis Z]
MNLYLEGVYKVISLQKKTIFSLCETLAASQTL